MRRIFAIAMVALAIAGLTVGSVAVARSSHGTDRPDVPAAFFNTLGTQVPPRHRESMVPQRTIYDNSNLVRSWGFRADEKGLWSITMKVATNPLPPDTTIYAETFINGDSDMAIDQPSVPATYNEFGITYTEWLRQGDRVTFKLWQDSNQTVQGGGDFQMHWVSGIGVWHADEWVTNVG